MNRFGAPSKLVLLVCVIVCISFDIIRFVQAKTTQRKLNSSELEFADRKNPKQVSMNHQQQPRTSMNREVQQQASNHLPLSFFDASASTMGGKFMMNEELPASTTADDQSLSNGTVILEDLVNRFLEQNQEIVARDTSDNDDSAEFLNLNLNLNRSMPPNSNSSKSAHGINRNDNYYSNNQPGIINQTHVEQPVSGDQPSVIDTMEVDPSYGLVQADQELDDRHIQYDMVLPQVNQQHQQDILMNDQQLYPTLKPVNRELPKRPNESTAKFSNYKLQLQDPMATSGVINDRELNQTASSDQNLNVERSSINNESPSNDTQRKNEPSMVDINKSANSNGGRELEQEPLGPSASGDHHQSGGQSGSGLILNSTTVESQLLAINLPAAVADQQSPQVTSGTGSSLHRSANIQARSMYSSGKLPPQHSRPPYATYDQFHQRSESTQNLPSSSLLTAQNGRQQQLSQVANSQQRTGNGGATDQPTLAHLANQLSPAPPSTKPVSSTSVNSTLPTANNSGGVNNITTTTTTLREQHQHITPPISADTTAIANSMNRISSHSASANYSSTGNNIKGEPSQQQVDNGEQTNSIADRRDELDNVENNKELQKLAPVNRKPVDLNPIPANDIDETLRDGNSTLLRDQSDLVASSALDSRYYYNSKENQLFNFYPAQHNRGGQNDRYSNGNEMLSARDQAVNDGVQSGGNDSVLDGSATTKLPHDFKNGAPHSRYHHDAPGMMHRKTLESVSHQLQQQNAMDLYGQNSAPATAAHDSSTSSVDGHHQRQHQQAASGLQHHLHQTGSLLAPTHYAASLINVTAPMVLPLSATEAMESTLAADQAAKNLLHQSSGFLRPSVSQQHQQNQYYLPNTAGEQSIYSQPANQFSPPKPLSTDDLIASLASSNTGGNLSSADRERMRLDSAGYLLSARRPSGTSSNTVGGATATPLHQASGFRSPQYHQQTTAGNWPSTSLPLPSNYLSNPSNPAVASSQPLGSFAASSPAPSSPSNYAESRDRTNQASSSPATSSAATTAAGNQPMTPTRAPVGTTVVGSSTPNPTTNGFITGSFTANSTNEAVPQITLGTTTPTTTSSITASTTSTPSTGINRRVFNLTRVEHISAECSNDFIRTVIVFNGTFKGIIYSSGYVRDPNCLYINGTGKTRYDFSIRLNQCGTLGRQELHSPSGPNDVRRRDQVMWNTLSIQYNPIIEQEWDEHFRVSCEYGSDFWKTVSFSPFNVETNTGSPVVFTVDPPQCQMEILRGHGMIGPRQEAVSGPVTVGDPLTLLIHMKSEKAGYDILVKNCIAHNGGHQKMQLIDSNGCVVNERFISPFRGTYNDKDLKHVTLYSYLKAFRFTGSPVLYLECEIHMCQNSCPPQMCYWRRLSKRSANDTTTGGQDYLLGHNDDMDSEFDSGNREFVTSAIYESPDSSAFHGDHENNQDHDTTTRTEPTTVHRQELVASGGRGRQARRLELISDESSETAARNLGDYKPPRRRKLLQQQQQTTTTTSSPEAKQQSVLSTGQVSDKVSLFQALEVRQEREPDAEPYSSYSLLADSAHAGSHPTDRSGGEQSNNSLQCYRRAEVLAFLFTAVSILLVAISVTVGCCWRAASLRVQDRNSKLAAAAATSRISSSANASATNSCPQSPILYKGSGACDATSRQHYATNILSPIQVHKMSSPTGSSLSLIHQHHYQQQQQQHSTRHKSLLSSNHH